MMATHRTLRLSQALAALFAGAAIGVMSPAASAANAGEQAAKAEYKADKQRCDSMKGNAEDVCQAEAEAKRDKAIARAKAAADPSAKATYDMEKVAAKADYKVSSEKCDDLSGNPKDVCKQEAKAMRDKHEADAKAAYEGSKDRKDAAGARKDAMQAKNDADYRVAKEKCDALSGNAKDACVSKAKATYHQ